MNKTKIIFNQTLMISTAILFGMGVRTAILFAAAGEYMINWQADYDLFSAFGCVTYGEDKTADEYMNELNFTDTQKRAFYDGRKEYYLAAEQAY